MRETNRDTRTAQGAEFNRRLGLLVLFGCGLVVGIGVLLTFSNPSPARGRIPSVDGSAAGRSAEAGGNPWLRGHSRVPVPKLPAEAIVTNKLVQFVQARRALLGRMAERFKVEVPANYEEFFIVAASGDWEKVQSAFKDLESIPREDNQHTLWQALKETYYVMEQTHKWPAQALLDYGQAVLGSLRPDMVYVGGTDPGRYIPTLLSETADGERHIVLTQNAFADASYLAYVDFLYEDRLKPLTGEDSQKAFQDYLTDAQRRLQHDQSSPNEPRQIRKGEDVKVSDNRVQVSGKVAVMSINEALLNTLMRKNPEMSFALEESFSLPSTYLNATPLGPILELGSSGSPSTLTAQQAEESLGYWRSAAQQFSSDPELPAGSEARNAWAHMALAQGNLFSSRNLPEQAEQAYRLAAEISPTAPELFTQLADLLARSGRLQEAVQALDGFAARNPGKAAEVQEDRNRFATLQNRAASPVSR